MNWKIACVFAACVATLVAQTPPVTILEVDIENGVCYIGDVDSASKRATVPTMVPAPTDPQYRTFKESVWMGDIVAVNGAPAMGACSCTVRGSAAVARLPPGIRSMKGPEQE